MNSQLAVQKLSALAQESRLNIFRLLVIQGDKDLCAGEISEVTGISANTLSFHLKELVTADLITSRKEGRNIFYSLNTSGYRKLLSFLTEDCCAGRPELCSPINLNKGCC